MATKKTVAKKAAPKKTTQPPAKTGKAGKAGAKAADDGGGKGGADIVRQRQGG
jgi:hypothetical protein